MNTMNTNILQMFSHLIWNRHNMQTHTELFQQGNTLSTKPLSFHRCHVCVSMHRYELWSETFIIKLQIQGTPINLLRYMRSYALYDYMWYLYTIFKRFWTLVRGHQATGWKPSQDTPSETQMAQQTSRTWKTKWQRRNSLHLSSSIFYMTILLGIMLCRKETHIRWMLSCIPLMQRSPNICKDSKIPHRLS